MSPLFKFAPITPCATAVVPDEESLCGFPVSPLPMLKGAMRFLGNLLFYHVIQGKNSSLLNAPGMALQAHVVFLTPPPGSYGNIYESSSLRPGQCSLSQGNLATCFPRWQGSSSDLAGGRQAMRRSQTTAAIAECQLHPTASRPCSDPHRDGGCRSSGLSHSRSEQRLTLSSVEDLSEHDSNAGCLQSAAKPSYRKERPPPPYPGPAKTSSSVSSTLHSLWRLQRPDKSSGLRAAGGAPGRAPEQATSRQEQPAPHTQAGHSCPTAPHSQNSKSASEADWNEWQRERWQIWELLSADNPDALPETLV